MNKQTIAIIGILVALLAAFGTTLAKCFDAQQAMIEDKDKTISKLHSDYNARIIDLIIKGQ